MRIPPWFDEIRKNDADAESYKLSNSGYDPPMTEALNSAQIIGILDFEKEYGTFKWHCHACQDEYGFYPEGSAQGCSRTGLEDAV